MPRRAIAIAAAVGLGVGFAVASSADAAISVVDFTQEVEFRSLAAGVGLGDGIAARGLIEGASFDNTLAFNLTETANISVSSTWFGKSIFSNSFDLNLFAPDGTVTNDGTPQFNNVTETVSSILLATNLAPGIYALRAEGNVFGQAAKYDFAVEVTPIPTGVALLGTGLAGLAAVVLRRRKAS
jgi:hypothetical protein